MQDMPDSSESVASERAVALKASDVVLIALVLVSVYLLARRAFKARPVPVMPKQA